MLKPRLSLPLNSESPQIMHIDLNSCFATVEQQARPLLRGKALGVTNRLSKNACVVAASIEAKALGVKVGMPFSEAKLLAPSLILVETDPPKYHHVYKILVSIMKSYSPLVIMKSIDEGIIDFHGTRQIINNRSLEDIGREIKQRMRDEVGCWMKCNVGIGPNRFLAKQAAGLNKPDGLDTIDSRSLRQIMSALKLTDLTGIAERNQARLNAHGIYTPLQFLDAPADLLSKRVFKSVCGDDWHKRLRGYEVDDAEHSIKTVGRQFVLDEWQPSEESLRSRLSYMCESVGLKMRHNNLEARGISVYVRYANGDYWHERKMFGTSFFSSAEIYRRATLLFNQRPRIDYEREMGVSCYGLMPSKQNQMSLLEEVNREIDLTKAVDSINRMYGDYTVSFGTSLPSKGMIKQKIPFGSTRYFELLCKHA